MSKELIRKMWLLIGTNAINALIISTGMVYVSLWCYSHITPQDKALVNIADTGLAFLTYQVCSGESTIKWIKNHIPLLSILLMVAYDLHAMTFYQYPLAGMLIAAALGGSFLRIQSIGFEELTNQHFVKTDRTKFSAKNRSIVGLALVFGGIIVYIWGNDINYTYVSWVLILGNTVRFILDLWVYNEMK